MIWKLSDLFPATEIVAVKGTLDRAVTSLTIDSRRVVPGSLYFALPGLRTDGGNYIDEAIDRGAVAVVAPRPATHPHTKVTFIQVADARTALAHAARRYFGEPDRALEVVGVTGTNGKTTVTHLLRHFLNGERRVGLIGTINYDLGGRTVPSYKTTPESPDIFGMLAQMRDAGCRQAVMEVSSHGIDQKRVLGLQFRAVVFTNLTRDHLDYHKTLDAYFEVKTRLFTGATGAPPEVAVVNLDDHRGRRLVDLVPAGVRVVTFGEATDAAVRAQAVNLEFKRTTFRLVWPGGAADIASPLIGRYNASNLLAALATAHGLGHDLAALVPKLGTFQSVAGRMERIEEGQAFNVLVDYAHTDDALRNALGMLRAVTPGRLLVVFGCGGNRDRTKRPLMMRAVQELADFAWVTADNPRSEPLPQIFADMRQGIIAPEKITFIDERRRALSVALDAARPGDCLLVAGKGHEPYQEFADTVIPFDDRQVVRELIAVKRIKDP
ncbi:MAG: UDP-N-acetylmuramoyl-L-alanyl-D-glutamate--2,6-diaminopimelate ligase [Verrucomicrobia bacterium RIFCSPLOWO2_12_FULL_64_8]|nr:MAG: UDP-N-acetylmuramoyl-L-alanyl-D-glutamate--2,6-diaminopimelate ligase [Verrucomicrobia bacterium RIFCSPLOWO2_12_FULL_64_8]